MIAKNEFCLILIILFFGNLVAQKEVFLDESMNEINAVQYSKKCESHIYKCLKYSTDSLLLNKILYKYSFGKISPNEYNQLRKLIVKSSETSIDSSAFLVIKFQDTLQNLTALKRIYDDHIRSHEKTNSIIKHEKKTIGSLVEDRAKWVRTKNKCIKKIESKTNARVYYVYKYENEAVSSYIDFNWIKDRGVFKHTFFRIMYNNNLVIIKPDGEYFLSGHHFSDKNIRKLLKRTDWSKYKEDWLNSIHSYRKTGIGMFKKELLFYNHKTHCF